MPVLLKNATFIDWQSLHFASRNILANEDDPKIKFVENDFPVTDNLQVLDCNGRLVTKSFGVGHHHVYSALSRGMRAPKKVPSDFSEILKYIWWTLDKCLDEKMIESSALVTAMECAKAGSTFVIDHHASPFAVKGSLEIIAASFEKVGVSHLLCYEISDRDKAQIAKEGLEETEQYLKFHQGLVGLHASFTVGDNTLDAAVEMMNRYKSGIHIHVSEDMYDQEMCIRKHGKRVIKRLNQSGVLSSGKTILSHCLHLDEEEKEIIRKSECTVVQNCESNLNNNVGYFNGHDLGERIMLGTDGMHSDMLRSAKASFFVGQRYDNINYSTAYKRFRQIHNYLSDNSFTGDGENNLVVLDYNPPTPVDKENFLGHFIFGITSNHVSDVISNGRLIVKDRRIINVDEDDIISESREQAKRLWERMSRAEFYK
jgi:cytosine/adenosine deaminase-related metal-dependent hydrolase